MQYHNILFFNAGGIRTLTHHVNVAHATREPGQQNNGYLCEYKEDITIYFTIMSPVRYTLKFAKQRAYKTENFYFYFLLFKFKLYITFRLLMI